MILNMAELLKKDVQDPQWVVKGVLPRGSLALLAGEAGSGKSIISYHMALCVAYNLPFLGVYPTESTRVLYIDEENGRPDATRYWQWTWRGLTCPDPQKLEEQLKVALFDLSTVNNWGNHLTRLAKEFQPGLIIIDTATPALRIVDENDNAEASQRVQGLRALQAVADNDTAILVLKHEKMRDDEAHRRTVRGAKAWISAADIVMFHSRGRGGKGKDGLRNTFLEADKPRAFGLNHKIRIEPSWTAKEEPRGLVLKGGYCEDKDKE